MRITLLLFILVFSSCQYMDYEKVTLRDGLTEMVKNVSVNDTLTYKYFDNGNIYQELRIKKGLNGHSEEIVTHYRKNGSLDKYSIYIADGLKFYKFYDKEKSYGGNPLLYYDLNQEYFDTIIVGSTIKLDFRIATPPHCIPHLMYGVYVENDRERDMKKDPVYELEIIEGKTAMVENYSEKGDFKRTLYWSIEDTLNNDFYNGKNILNYNVKNN